MNLRLIAPAVIALGVAPSLVFPGDAPKKAPRKKPAAKKPADKRSAGPAINENKATPANRINTLPRFQVQMLYTVPNDEQGSWVALTKGPGGKLYASDQGDKGIYEITITRAGKTTTRQLELFDDLEAVISW